MKNVERLHYQLYLSTITQFKKKMNNYYHRLQVKKHLRHNNHNKDYLLKAFI